MLILYTKLAIKNFLVVFLLSTFACRENVSTIDEQDQPQPFSNSIAKPKLSSIESKEIRQVLENAAEQTNLTRTYDPSYIVIPYPNGDVPIETGVCTDVVIRAFRNAGVDLQKEVHEDMRTNFAVYPKNWGLNKPDRNIDHRRVPNLQTFFERKGKSLQVTDKAEDYQPGDVVSWDLDGKGMTHIGLVSNIWNEESGRYLIIHNIGSGAKAEDVLFDWKITGHFRYF
ncbi:MAG TPA: DUF1287 domain-containing protein [Pyrinomonadaceae bacterium]|nr:DUF1287 domain-containing protein [Pyrinomonadaceae bacterium]